MRQVVRGLTAGLVGLFAVYTLFPIVWTLLLSFKSPAAANAAPPTFGFTPTWANYSQVFSTSLPYLANSVIVAAASTAISMAAGTLSAYAFARFKIVGKEALMFTVLSTLIVPPIVIAIPLYYLAVRLGIEGSILAVVLAQSLFNTPFVVWMMRSFFAELPISIHEAALMDGASTWQAFWAIALPLVRPGLAATATLSAFYSWNEFLLANVLTASSSSQTLPVYIAGFQRDTTQVLWGQLGATVMLGVVPVIICTLVAQRFLVRGLAFGAVKG
jgi:multiple sugar transport system permease protein